ncbi:MAG: M23 family metallopeptidase [Longimicrobiales bacterium]
MTSASIAVCSLGVLVVAVVSPSAATAQVPLRVTWSPDAPVQGTLFQVQAVPLGAGIVAVTGSIADEPLHFVRSADGGFSALAAAPLDVGSALDVPLNIYRKDGVVEIMRVRVPISAGAYPLERLTVAPRFGAPPDSLTQIRLARDQALAAHVSRNTHVTPRLWQDVVLPRTTRITSRFGSGREFNGQIHSRHTGTDLAGTSGAPVLAAARGVVALVDTFYLAGNVIYIDHGAGLVSAYFHLSAQEVAAGDTVTAGQPIGRVGATGRVTGPHLHWVVRYGGISVDPMSLFDLLAPAGTRSP